jgi:two-component system, cell cycle sensor histidine kinase and response regulator CckA
MFDRGPTYDSIARRAFRLFETRGREHGYDLADWLRAETESKVAGAERKQTEEELRTSGAKHRNLFETMAQGVIYYDSEARIISGNPAAERILGVPLDQLQGRTALDPSFNATHEDGSDLSTETHPAVVSLKTGKNTDSITMRIFNPKERQYRWILMAGVPQFKRGERRPSQVYITFDDITERRMLREQLAQAQKMEAIGRLAGGVAHDFNNLLNVIIGYSDLLLLRMQEGDQRSAVENIRKAAGTAAALTRQLLAFSRREALAPKVLDLNRVVSDIARMLPRLIGENIQIETVLSPELGRVRAGVGQIEQVILNLAANGRDAMQNGGKLTIETKNVYQHGGDARHRRTVPAGWYVGLTVTDTGKGMDENTLSRIFEPYFTTKEMGKGTGLGLAAVYGIVDQTAGHIWVDSKPGHGTTFEIYLPRVEEAAAPEEPAKVSYEALRGSETILLVEDSEALREMTCAFLRMQGYTVIEATNGVEAVEAIQQYKAPIHLMLTDVVMPGINGPELAKRAATLCPDMKVLYASGYARDLLEACGASAPDIPLLEKPFNFDSLAQEIRELLGQEKPQKIA